MGARYDEALLRGTTKDELREEFRKVVERSRYESGHSYSGELGMKDSLYFEESVVYENFNDAYNALVDHRIASDKWDPRAVAVPLKDGRWFVLALCPS